MSNHPTHASELLLANLKAVLESERTKEKYKHHTARAYRLGHEAATERLMAIVEKAVEMAEFYGDRDNYECLDLPYPEVFTDDGKKAREFLLSIRETNAAATTLADASGEMNKDGE